MVVGKVRQSRALNGLIGQAARALQLSDERVFTEDIAHDLFMKHAVPEIRRHQLDDLKAAQEDIRAVILIGIAPSYPKI